ncbi:hypothetical protein EV677_0688 [Herminiimonas fonticola]|uniref:Uncharacterized protein n=1 Tax=Herminiimonas fonticola TaxID=303380 RepID=A0A4R6GH40_9BURK|nr:hypothetical protein Hfont_0665 [Herminiimonas fonticola]TDN94147.1 hypothetical protein EV677_0688 [Herminiimonas fonticola]
MALLITDTLHGISQGMALCRSAQQAPASACCIRSDAAYLFVQRDTSWLC